MRARIRQSISNAVASVCGAMVDFRTGFVTYMNAGGFNLPCVWLCPLDMVGKTGRMEGGKDYAGTMYMLESIEGLTEEQKDAAWDRMEGDAISILGVAASKEEGIVCIDNVQCLPDEYAYTGFNTISIEVKFNVKTSYCENR